MKILLAFSGIFLLIIGLSCTNFNSQENHADPAPLNPNGDTELALLMREMFEDGMRIKQEIEKGKMPEILKKFEAIHTAEATEPEKANSETYKNFADAYLTTLKNLEAVNSDELYNAYQGMVQSCMNCHQVLCPGPMVRIKKLYLPVQ